MANRTTPFNRGNIKGEHVKECDLSPDLESGKNFSSGQIFRNSCFFLCHVEYVPLLGILLSIF